MVELKRSEGEPGTHLGRGAGSPSEICCTFGQLRRDVLNTIMVASGVTGISEIVQTGLKVDAWIT